MIEYIKSIIKSFLGKSAYKKNVLYMVVGRIVAQALPIILTPIITRIYSPEEFGFFAVFLSVVSFVAMISNARYSQAIILPKSNKKALELVFICGSLTIAISFLFFIIVSVFSKEFFEILNIQALENNLVLFVLTILFVGLHEPLFYYSLREKKYKRLAVNLIVQSIVMITIRLVTGWMGFTEIGLVVSYLGGYIASTALLVQPAKIKSIFPISIVSVINQLFKYSKFFKYSLFSDSLSVLATNTPNLLLNKFIGSAEAGHFSMSEKVLGAPTWLVSSSISDVFKQEFAEQYRNGSNCKLLFEKTAKTLFTIGFAPFLIIFIVSPYVIPFLLGEIWTPVGDYIRIFSILYFTSFIVNPLKAVTYIVNKQQYRMLFESLRLSAIVISFLIGYYLQDTRLTLILLSISVTLTNIIVFMITYKLARDINHDRRDSENN